MQVNFTMKRGNLERERISLGNGVFLRRGYILLVRSQAKAGNADGDMKIPTVSYNLY
jgi:hypothetical protein